jgi:gliding motility-associated-like protein
MNKKIGYNFFFLITGVLLMLAPADIFAQPSVQMLSTDTAICESGVVTMRVKFEGKAPFGFAYEKIVNGQVVGIEKEMEGSIFDNVYEKDLSVNGSVKYNIVKVYDDTTEKPWRYPDNGVDVTGQVMNIVADAHSSPSAGADITAQCGYKAVLDASPEDETHPHYWVETTKGDFDDRMDPKTTFTANDKGNFTLYFIEESGVCKDTASVKAELLGSPKATLTGQQTICSTDGKPDKILLTVVCEDAYAPFSYTVSDGTNNYDKNGEMTNPSSINVPAEGNQVFRLTSLSDTRSGKQCFASGEEMKGEAVVTDLKPAAYPGPGDTICGDLSVKLEAELEKTGNTGRWSAVDVTFSNDTDPNATATVAGHGIYTLTWTETEPKMGCKDSNRIVLNYAELPGLTYSNDTSICRGSNAMLKLNATGNSPWQFTYTIDGSGTEITLDSPEETISMPLQETSIVVLDSIVGNYGCVRHINGNYVVTVDDMPQAFGGVYDPVCSNEIQLNAVPSIVNSSGFWQGTGTFEDPRSNSTLFTAAGYGEQMLSWTEVNTKNENCKDISLVTIRFDEMPDDPYAGKDQKIYLEYSAILEADPAGLGLGTWTASNPEISIEDPNDPNTAVENLKMGTQIFTWTVVNGVCEAKADSMVIEVKGLTYPNGFSPNGDGVNDLFKIMGAWKIGDNELMVFDRNGKLVYSQKNYRNDWNGTGMDGSPLDDGTYYYIFTGKNIDPIKEYLIIKRTKNNR